MSDNENPSGCIGVFFSIAFIIIVICFSNSCAHRHGMLVIKSWFQWTCVEETKTIDIFKTPPPEK